MEELQKDFDNFLLDAQIKGYSLKTIMGWIRQRVIIEGESIPIEPPVKPERAEMKLYKVLLAYSYNNEKIFTFLVVASCIEEATDLAIKTFKSYDYGDCQFSSVSLLAEEGQYGKPQILIIAEH